MNKQLIHIVVSAKSNFGVLDKTTEKWFNPSKKEMLKEFLVDTEYDVEVEDSVGKNGKTYTNIVAIVGRKAVEAKPATASKFKGHQSDMAKTDWAAKDRSQLIGGLSHDAATLTAAAINGGLNLDEVLKQYKTILVGVIAIRDAI